MNSAHFPTSFCLYIMKFQHGGKRQKTNKKNPTWGQPPSIGTVIKNWLYPSGNSLWIPTKHLTVFLGLCWITKDFFLSLRNNLREGRFERLKWDPSQRPGPESMQWDSKVREVSRDQGEQNTMALRVFFHVRVSGELHSELVNTEGHMIMEDVRGKMPISIYSTLFLFKYVHSCIIFYCDVCWRISTSTAAVALWFEYKSNH